MKTKTMRILKFIGSYKDLKPNGFEFQRLYANNYMQWCKEIDGQTIRVWKKGNDVEINALYGWSGIVAEFIRDNEPETTKGVPGLIRPWTWWRCVLNTDTDELFEYNRMRHEGLSYSIRDEGGEDWDRLRAENKAALIPDITCQEYLKTYRAVKLTNMFGLAVRELFSLGWVEIVNEERKVFE